MMGPPGVVPSIAGAKVMMGPPGVVPSIAGAKAMMGVHQGLFPTGSISHVRVGRVGANFAGTLKKISVQF